MRIIKASVEQITPPIDGMEFLKAIEAAGRVCYKSEEKITDESAPAFVAKLIKSGHEAMIEHAPSISMKFICDRGVSHEIVRHRLFSFAQESTRYCNYGEKDMVFILPCWFEEELKKYLLIRGCFDIDDEERPNANAESYYWMESMLSAEIIYGNLISLGWPPQQARSVLPNSLKTEIIVTGNVREWRHFFRLRTAKTAHPQMQEVANIALEMLRAQIPVVFDDI
jgi:thymidylate synthase, flavin-dependent